MKFIDEAKVKVKAGKGGPGASQFRREKFVPFGGPDGGDGGAGGSVILVADRNVQTLLDLKFRPIWEAGDGSAGAGANRSGKSGDDLIIRVPIGTQIFNVHPTSLEILDLVYDLDFDSATYSIAKGGRGGKGNAFFKTATRQAPEYAQPGEPGEEGQFLLSLKLVADVGLIGYPNAGKSTLISSISAARPKIADYPFTTLVPNLGVVRGKGSFSFVVADIPGIIEGAHEGKGLGLQFLKHVERARILCHIIDVFQPGGGEEGFTVLDAYNCINAELKGFSEKLSTKPQILALNKIDLVFDREQIDSLVNDFKKLGVQVVAISGVSKEGTEQLVDLLTDNLQKLAPVPTTNDLPPSDIFGDEP